MTRINPFDEMNSMFDRMSRQFDDTWGGFGRTGWMDTPAIDVAEYHDELVVVVDLPGFERDDIDLTVHDNVLRIAAEHTADQTDENADAEEAAWVRHERRAESVRRHVSLPGEVDEHEASATYTNGVLTVTLPKIHEDDEGESHRIDVN